MSIGLGIPAPPAPTLAPRRKTRQLMVGDVGVGSDHPISVQSMCTTKTRNDNANYLWIQEFYSALKPSGRAGFVMANSAGDAGHS